MGWWNQGADGSSLHREPTGLVWGDAPADVLDEALDSIYREFQRAVGRQPTDEELRAGFEFAMGGRAHDDAAAKRS